MIKLYWTDVTSLPDPAEERDLLYNVPEERRESVLRALKSETRKLRLGAGILLGDVLQRYGISYGQVSFGKNGKPRTEGLCLNLSHSGERAYLAVSEGEIGCDAEKIKEIPKGVLDRFSDAEREMVSREPSEWGKAAAFYLIWTRKESFVKMTGEGVGKVIETTMGEDGVICGGERVRCAWKSFLHDGYAVSVCTEREEMAEIEENGVGREKFRKKIVLRSCNLGEKLV